MEAPDKAGRARLWLASLDHSAPLRQIPNVEGGQPHFGPSGEILFRHNEGTSNASGGLGFIYRVLPDGTGLQKVFEQPVSLFNFPRPISPDGRSVFAWAALPEGARAARCFRSTESRRSTSAAMDKSVGELGERCCRTLGRPMLSIFRWRLARLCPIFRRTDFAPTKKSPACPAGVESRAGSLRSVRPPMSMRSIAAPRSGIFTGSRFREPRPIFPAGD